MKICVISNYKKNGYGESTRPYYLSLFLKKLGHDVIHLCKHEGVEDGIRYINIDTETWQPSAIERVKEFVPLYTRLRLFAPDIIYCHQINVARWALSTKVLPACTMVMDAHTTLYFEHKTFGIDGPEELMRMKNTESSVFEKMDYIICASEETRQVLIKDFALSSQKLFAVGNATGMKPVSPEDFIDKGAEFTCLVTLPQDGFTSNRLALNYLFEIAKDVYAGNPLIKFIVVGGGEKPIAPTPNIIYAGYVPDLRKEILSANICLMPFPDKAVCGGARNKFCDYIALGKVVVTSTEGLRGMEILEDKKNCIVAADKAAFVEAILKLSKAPDKVLKIEEQVLKIKDYYNWFDRAKQVEQIFKSITKPN